MQPLPGITHDRFSLFRFRSPLLTESLLFSLPVGTEMFHFPTFPLPALYIQAGVTRSLERPGGVSPFGDPRITALLSAPRGLSQIYTSFFGSRCQGIHRLLLKTSQTKFAQQRPMHPNQRLGNIDYQTTKPPHPERYEFIRVWRCSRPLCSSQNTGGTPNDPSIQMNRNEAQSSTANPPAVKPRQQGCPVPQDPTACTTRPPD